MKRNVIKITIFSLIMIGAGFFVGGILAEGVLRLFHPIPLRYVLLPPGMYQADEHVGWKHTPNFQGMIRLGLDTIPVQINAQGFRQTDNVKENNINILFLGDSFTFGLGVNDDETFVALIQNQFDDDIHCLNGGVNAYALPQYRLALEQRLQEMKPDIVLVCLYPENDFDTAWSESDAPWMESHRPSSGKAGGLVYKRSHLYRLIKHTILDPPQKSASHSILQPFENNRDAINLLREHINQELTRMVQLSLDSSFQFGIVILPSLIQTENDAWQQINYSNDTQANAYDAHSPNALVIEWATESNVQCLDLTPMFADQPSPADLYIPSDRHFNQAGHRLAANEIKGWLLKAYIKSITN